MRNITPLMIAFALTAAAPAVAQGTDNVANADTTAAAATNEAAPADSMTVTTDPAMAGNDMTAAPVAMDEPVAAPAPAEKKSFPWGVLGVLGLLGILGRKRG